MIRKRLAVLASGGGSNLQAIIDHHAMLGNRRVSDIAVVLSDRRECGALGRARNAGIEARSVSSRFTENEEPLEATLESFGIELVILAGYLQLIPASVVRRFHRRILNVHPAPLPAFGGHGMYGANVHKAVLDARSSWSGPSVHYADEEYDRGPVIAHWPVAVLDGDTAETLASRVLRAEHVLYPRVIEAAARGIHADTPAVLPPLDVSLTDTALAAIADASLALLTN